MRGLTDEEGFPPGQPEAFPFEPETVDHFWSNGSWQGGLSVEKDVNAGSLENIRNVIGYAE